MAHILIVDDDEIFSEMLATMVTRMGHEASQCYDLGHGIEAARNGSFDLMFLDVRLPDGNGLDVLPLIREIPSGPEIIIITGYGDAGGAEMAMKNNVWDYIQKSSPIEEVMLHLVRALQYRREKNQKSPAVALKVEGIVGRSPPIVRCLDTLAEAASSDANLLITGETGTGKELFARAVHASSARANGSFVVVDCASLPETLAQSILFGHERGAFTGADKRSEGLVALADRGTLFLDEVGELPLGLQKTFLRVLQERRFRPLGSRVELKSNFRLISATNRSLTDMVLNGQLREDLLFRLRTLVIDLPPLRERREDIKDLALNFMKLFCERYGMGTKGFSPDFLEALTAYSWPGNVRELMSAVERALSTAGDKPTLFSFHLPLDVRIKLKREALGEDVEPADAPVDQVVASDVLPDFKTFMTNADREAKHQYLERLMALARRNIAEACRISGLSRSRLYAVLKEVGRAGARPFAD